MEKAGAYLFQMSSALGLPPETVGQVSQVLISGRYQVTIEGHRGIRHYEPTRIEVRGLKGAVCITGQKLQVASLSPQQAAIRGCIDAVFLEGAE